MFNQLNFIIMAKSKEQVLAVAGLTAAQKERAEAFFQTLERFKKPLLMEVNTNQEVKDYLNKMIEQYNKRKEREEKKKVREQEAKAQLEVLSQLIKSGKEYGFEFEDIINIVNDAMKERKNAAILAKIDELKAQLI